MAEFLLFRVGVSALDQHALARDLVPLLGELPVGVVSVSSQGEVTVHNAAAASLMTGSIGEAIRVHLDALRAKRASADAPVEASISHPGGDLRIVLDRGKRPGEFVALVERTLERRLTREVRALRSMMHASLEAGDPSAALAAAAAQLAAALSSVVVLVYALRDESGPLVLQFSVGPDLGLPETLPLPAGPAAGATVLAHAVARRSVLHITPCSPSRFHDDPPSLRGGPWSALAVPLVCGGMTVGGMLVASPQPNLGDDQIRLLLGFGDTVAILLERTRSAARFSHLQDQIASSDQQTMFGRLAGGLAHKVNNLLGTSLLNLSWLEERVDALAAGTAACLDEQRRDLRQGVRDLQSAISQLRLLAGRAHRCFDRSPAATTFNPSETLRDAAQLFATARPRCSVIADVPPMLPLIRGRPNELAAVVLHLLDAGYQAARPGPTLSLRARASGTHLRVLLRDEGQEVSAEPSPPRPGDASSPTAAPALPLGLRACQSLLEGMGGRLTLRPAAPERAVAAVEIPIEGGLRH